MEYEEKYSKYQLHLFGEPPSFLGELDLNLNSKLVLDLGCGGGVNSFYIKQSFPEVRLVSIDLSGIRCKRCKQNVDAFIIQADSTYIPLNDHMFDMVVCTMLIEHIPDDRSLVQEIHRILKPGGQLFISSVIKGKYAWYFRRNQFGEFVTDSTHLHEYRSEEEFKGLFDQFEILKLKQQKLAFSWARFIYRLLVKSKIIKTPDPHIFNQKPILKSILNWKLTVPNYKTVELLGIKKQIKTP